MNFQIPQFCRLESLPNNDLQPIGVATSHFFSFDEANTIAQAKRIHRVITKYYNSDICSLKVVCNGKMT